MRKVATLVFIAIAAFLYATRYVCAALVASSFTSQSSELFNHAYRTVGLELTVLSSLSLATAFVCWFKAPLLHFLWLIIGPTENTEVQPKAD